MGFRSVSATQCVPIDKLLHVFKPAFPNLRKDHFFFLFPIYLFIGSLPSAQRWSGCWGHRRQQTSDTLFSGDYKLVEGEGKQNNRTKIKLNPWQKIGIIQWWDNNLNKQIIKWKLIWARAKFQLGGQDWPLWQMPFVLQRESYEGPTMCRLGLGEGRGCFRHRK